MGCFFLFLYVLYFLLLWFMHLKKQQPFPSQISFVRGRSSPISLLNILWGYIISGFVCVISQSDRFAGFFFRILESYSLLSFHVSTSFLSAANHWDILLSVYPRNTKYVTVMSVASQVRQKSPQRWNIWHMCHSSPLSLKWETMSPTFSPVTASCSSFCLQYYKFFCIARSCWALLFSVVPRHPKYAVPPVLWIRQDKNHSLR